MNYKVNDRDISEIAEALFKITTDYDNDGRVDRTKTDNLRKALNRVFKDTNCKGVLFTNNTDRMFFGMCVMPIITPDDLNEILVKDDPFLIKNYYLELDSKLFNKVLNLNLSELTAIILHEIGHLVNTGAPVEKVRNGLDTYLMNMDDTLSLTKSEQYAAVIAFAVKDAIRKATSMFETTDKEEILADEFVISCGYGEYLLSALKKIDKEKFKINKDVQNKFAVLVWALNLYKNIKDRRVAAIHTINKAKKTTGSVLIKKELDDMADNINDINLVRESDDTDSKKRKYQFKYDILRKYEDDYYECAIRLKSANIEEDALRLLRSINSRLSVIEEFLDNVDLQEFDRKRFTKLYNNYIELRDALGKKNIVKDKYIGLWVEYPEL